MYTFCQLYTSVDVDIAIYVGAGVGAVILGLLVKWFKDTYCTEYASIGLVLFISFKYLYQ